MEKRGIDERYEEHKDTGISDEKLINYSEKIETLLKEISKVFIGQKEIVKMVIVSLICDGHALLEGVPGLAKSLLVETLAKTVAGTVNKRIQFVPDMLPADIIGVNAYNPKTGEFYIVKGPVFANFILADEINRAPPKTQAAMMEVMQERKVNISGKEFKFPRPFLVLATQNPVEQYGTYPLPEAIVDRFFMKLILDYPKPEEEVKIIDMNTITKYNSLDVIQPVLTPEDIIDFQNSVRKVFISQKVKEYIVRLVNTSRGRGASFKGLKYIKYGGSPRAIIWLSLGARAIAMMSGRDFVVPDDVRAIIHHVLRHRLILNYEGKAAGISTDELVDNILDVVEVP